MKIDSKDADSLVGQNWEGYMDATDFLYEAGDPPDGNQVFARIKSLRESHKCAASCGIVKVKVELVEWVELPTGEHI